LSNIEVTRRTLDLFVVSVLLDAGAGNVWSYHDAANRQSINRSEGLAVASLDMFLAGIFSSDPEDPHRVDAQGLLSLTVDQLSTGLQVSDTNPLVGLEGRCSLLQRLGQTMLDSTMFFPTQNGLPPRPGNLLDYLLSQSSNPAAGGSVDLRHLWAVVIEGLAGIWPPTRTLLNGQSLGDVWVCPSLAGGPEAAARSSPGVDQLVPFHKLSQWLTYSVMEPITLIMGLTFDGVEHLTGLPEYRNGGLFVDLGVLELKTATLNAAGSGPDSVPSFNVDDPAVVEWRALTVILLDKTAEKVRGIFGLTSSQLPLAQILEGGTWKAGREIAQRLRPDTRGPPIAIISDGTVF
ncbi:hypothetical protein BJ085DRAFT_36570, partial [Dimargaris cristalligena]